MTCSPSHLLCGSVLFPSHRDKASLHHLWMAKKSKLTFRDLLEIRKQVKKTKNTDELNVTHPSGNEPVENVLEWRDL